ncbi:MAG: DUF1800 domain-containing protein [Mycobacteriales bacterium]
MVAMEPQRAALAHLHRRAGFGASPETLDADLKIGYDAAVDRLLRPPAADPGAVATPAPRFDNVPRPKRSEGADAKLAYRKARKEQTATLTGWWVQRMARVEHPFVEKLTLLWHNHWATSVQKSGPPGLMRDQIETLRRLGTGDFRDLARAMVRNPALLIWLDGPQNKQGKPNENLGRELMELFTLGVGNYSETDVREAARALTGWTVDQVAGTSRLSERRHDRGQKTILGETAAFDDRSLVDHIVAQPNSARHVATRLWTRLATPSGPPEDVMTRLVSAYGPGRNVSALVRAILLDPAFRSTSERGALVKQPVEYVVGVLRALRLPADRQAMAALRGLGQVPLRPPSVGGWPAGAAWLTPSSTQARLQFAQWAAKTADLSTVNSQPPAARIDGVARLLSVDAWTPRTRTALAAASVDTTRLVTLALVSPEYVVN